MNEPTNGSNTKPKENVLSSVLFVIGAFAGIDAVIGFCCGWAGLGAGIWGLVISVVFFALGRAIDCLQESVERLRRIEDLLDKKKE